MSIDAIDQIPIRPNNLLLYMTIINEYAKDKFDFFANKFLEMSCNKKCKHLSSHEKDLQELILYINENISTPEGKQLFYQQISILFLNKILLVSTLKPNEFCCYLVNLKNLTKKAIRRSKRRKYTYSSIIFLSTLCEVISKYISIILGTNSVSNIYKQEIDNDKVRNIFTNIFTSKEIHLDFEKKMLHIFK